MDKCYHDPIKFGKGLTSQLYLRHIIDRLEGKYQQTGEKRKLIDTVSIDYVLEFPEEVITPPDYQPLDLEQAWHQEQAKKEELPEEYLEPEKEEDPLEVMSGEKAAKTVQEIQRAYLLQHSVHDVDYDKRRQFHVWQLFHKAELMLYHSLSPVRTDDVDYGRTL